ncbi:hypothetical protein [Smaragdicoccus niigatensis]|uniref:hypothetical protein n=1 Tax=Smaragdicoccus niigatensis TaxID=359359 RepID=UPI00035F9D35|nr:hypothetical protein [Smaragdicoccus niigatensis]
MILGLAGTALGAAAFFRSESAFTTQTINLKGGKPDVRVSYPAPGIPANHPNGNLVEVRNSKVTGDRTGEYVRTCTPVMDDEIECDGAFRLSDGTVEILTTEHDDPGEITATAAISGGTGAYVVAVGTVEVNFDENTYSLRLILPKL